MMYYYMILLQYLSFTTKEDLNQTEIMKKTYKTENLFQSQSSKRDAKWKEEERLENG